MLADRARKMSRPLVSILIPCHNAAPWLAEAVESSVAQTWPEKEIVLVDDGSTDNSLEIARGFENRGVRVLAQTNRGASAARNVALRASSGNYVQFLDADDLLDPGKIAAQMTIAVSTGGNYAFCGSWSRFRQSISEAAFPAEPLCTNAHPVDWMILKFEQNAMMHPGAWLLPRSLVDKIGPWDETLSLDDDGEYFSRAVLASSGVRFCPDAISYYRSSLRGSLSKRRTADAWESALRSLVLSSERLLKAENSPRTRKACATVFQRYIHETYPFAADCRERAAELVARHGGSDLRYEAGPRFQNVSRLLGWRLAKRLKLLFQSQ